MFQEGQESRRGCGHTQPGADEVRSSTDMHDISEDWIQRGSADTYSDLPVTARFGYRRLSQSEMAPIIQRCSGLAKTVHARLLKQRRACARQAYIFS